MRKPTRILLALVLTAAVIFTACRVPAMDMDVFENIIASLDYVLNTTRKRHITGGILLSVSMLFGGLAITVMTIKNGEDDDE